MTEKIKGCSIFLLITVFIAGCATQPVKDESHSQKTTGEKSFFVFSPSDTDLVREALDCLNNKEGEQDYNAAKAKLDLLVQKHPKSKWAVSAHSLIQAIDNMLALQNEVKAEKQALDKANADKSKLLRENEKLKKEYKILEERYQTEPDKLRQENEQLRNDMELLKKLEIQLEKREKMLK